MKAVALTHYLPIDNPHSLVDVELPKPSAPTGHDLLVRVEAISVNPSTRSCAHRGRRSRHNPGCSAMTLLA